MKDLPEEAGPGLLKLAAGFLLAIVLCYGVCYGVMSLVGLVGKVFGSK